MQSPTLQRASRRKRNGIGQLRADDFRRLGLGLSEARVSVIRRAAKKMTADLAGQTDTPQHGKAERELALVLASVYRLLDPRRRDQLAERVQLLRSEPTPVRTTVWWNGSELDSSTDPNSQSIETERDEDWMLALVADLRTDTAVHQLPPKLGYLWMMATGALAIAIVSAIGVWLGSLLFTTPDRSGTALATPVPSTVTAVESWDAMKLDPKIPVTLPTPPAVPSEPTKKPGEQSPLVEKPLFEEPLPVKKPLAVEEPSDLVPTNSKPTETAPSDIFDDLTSPSNSSPIDAMDLFVDVSLPPTVDATPSIKDPTEGIGNVALAPNPSPYSLPSADLLADARRLYKNAGGAALGAAIGEVPDNDLWAPYKQAVPGTASRFVIGLSFAEHSLLAGNFTDVQQAMETIRTDYEITEIALSLLILAGSAEQAATLTEHERMTHWALQTSDRAMSIENYEQAAEAAKLGTLSAAATGNTELRARLKLQRESVSAAARLSPTLTETIANQDPFTSNPSVAASVARHFCINLRRWDDGLAWMASGSDARLAAIAREELANKGSNNAQNWANMAQKWSDATARQRGRASDSILLHARDLLQRAIDLSTGIELLELQKELSALDQRLPSDLVPLKVQVENANPVSLATPGLLGRMTMGGQDVGVLLTYSADVALPPTAMDQVLVQLGRPVGVFQLHFAGVFVLAQPTTIRVDLQGPTTTDLLVAGGTLLAINGNPLVLATTDGRLQGVLDLPAGTHRIAWQLAALSPNACRLIIEDDRTSSSIPLGHDQVTRSLAEQLPTVARIELRGR